MLVNYEATSREESLRDLIHKLVWWYLVSFFSRANFILLKLLQVQFLSVAIVFRLYDK